MKKFDEKSGIKEEIKPFEIKYLDEQVIELDDLE